MAAEPQLTPSVEDRVASGTARILKSPHVSEGPGRLANAPVPSIFSDDRGEIHRLRVGGKRMNLLYSKASVMRSGYLHPNNMHDFVLSGKVEVWTLTEVGSEEKKVYGPTQHILVKPYTPHILHFLEDTVLVEWWEPGPFQCWYYHPYRRIVDVQNSLVSKATGIFHKLVPQDDPKASQSSPTSFGKVMWWTTGLVTGVAIGVLAVIGGQKRS